MTRLKALEKQAYKITAYIYYFLAMLTFPLTFAFRHYYTSVTFLALGLFFHWISHREYLPLSNRLGEDT